MIKFIEIKGTDQATEAYAAALIRNECAQFMTNDQGIIDVEHQLDFITNPKRRIRLFLLTAGGIPIGYATTKTVARKQWLTVGLAKPFRGFGYGRKVFIAFSKAARRSGYTPWLDVLRTNERAIRLYTSIGFKVVRKNDRVLVMKLPKTANL